MADLSDASKNREAIATIKRLYLRNVISRSEAVLLAEPVIERINTKRAEIAAKHGVKNYPRESFINLMR